MYLKNIFPLKENAKPIHLIKFGPASNQQIRKSPIY
jgi:hypothetical protein